MQTKPDLIKQAQCEIDSAIAKRNRARQMLHEAEEEYLQAQIKLREAEKAAKKAETRAEA